MRTRLVAIFYIFFASFACINANAENSTNVEFASSLNSAPCKGTDLSKWTNCVGVIQSTSNIPINSKYAGEFHNGEATGWGIVKMFDDLFYVGQFKGGKKDGKGAPVRPDGSLATNMRGESSEGVWSNNLFISAKEITDPTFLLLVKKIPNELPF